MNALRFNFAEALVVMSPLIVLLLFSFNSVIPALTVRSPKLVVLSAAGSSNPVVIAL